MTDEVVRSNQPNQPNPQEIYNEIVKHTRNNNYEDICISSINTNNLEVVKLAVTHSVTHYMVYCAVKKGNLEILKYLKQIDRNESNWDYNIFYHAAAIQHGHLTALKWLIEHKYVDDYHDLLYFAAKSGHLHILQYLTTIAPIFTTDLCFTAAQNGHFEVLKWLRENNCPWDSDTCVGAVEYGDLKILNWILKNGCPTNFYSYDKDSYNIYYLFRNYNCVTTIKNKVEFRTTPQVDEWLNNITVITQNLPISKDCIFLIKEFL